MFAFLFAIPKFSFNLFMMDVVKWRKKIEMIVTSFYWVMVSIALIIYETIGFPPILPEVPDPLDIPIPFIGILAVYIADILDVSNMREREENTSASPVLDVNKQAEAIISLAPQMSRLGNRGLRAKTGEFRKRLRGGETLDDILPEAFAVAREAFRRKSGLNLFEPRKVYNTFLGSKGGVGGLAPLAEENLP